MDSTRGKELADPVLNFPVRALDFQNMEGSLYLYTMLGGFFLIGRILPLWPTGKVIGKTCHFREIPVMRKERGQTRRGYYGKIVRKSRARTV